MKVKSIKVQRVQIPPRRPHRIAGAPSGIGKYSIIQIETDSGEVGLGESTVLPDWGGEHMKYSGETNETVASVIGTYLSPVVVNQDPLEIQRIDEKMDTIVSGHPYAKAAINMALYDIMGKYLGQPVYRLLGAGGYRTRIPIAHSIGLMDVVPAVDEAEAAVGDRIQTIKIKVGENPDRDVEVVKRIRERIGSGIRITIDGNQGYSTPKLAIKTLKRMEPYDVELVEQPVEGIYQMAQVRREIQQLLMADEGAWTPQDVLNISRLQSADAISIYTTKPGGLTKAVKVAAVAEAAGFPCNVNGSAETGVGSAADLHLAASSAVIDLPCVFPITNLAGREQTRTAGKFYLDDIVKEPYRYEDGFLLVPQTPGLGCELDPEKMTKYALAS
jgi:L-alanine-DL-glutamate epimerase-like enolase superfamily enzyme